MSLQYSLLDVVDGKVKYSKCTSCALASEPRLKTNCMDGVGPKNCDFMFVGKSPAGEDDAYGRPMTGKNGRLFQELLQEAGIDIRKVYVTNCIKCAPYDAKLKDSYFKACKSHLLREINIVKPKAIIAVGAEALTWLTGMSGIKKLRKKGLPCILDEDRLVFPLGQPAQIFHAQGAAKTRTRNELLEDLRWLKDRAAAGQLSMQDDIDLDYKQANTVEDVIEFYHELKQYPELSVDLETARNDFTKGQLFPDQNGVIVAAGFSGRPGHGRAIPIYALGLSSLHYWTDEELEQIWPYLIDLFTNHPIFGQNFIQFDQKWIRYFFETGRLENINYDTLYGHYLLDETKGSHDLESQAQFYTTMAPWKKMFNPRDINKLCYYLCRDVDAGFRVKQAHQKHLTDKQQWLLKELCIPLGHELCDMEYRGVRIDPDAMKKAISYISGRRDEEEKKLRAMPEVQAFELQENKTLNVDSHAHLRIIMKDILKLPALDQTGSGEYSTNKEVLEAYSRVPFVAGVQACRSLGKLDSTYCTGFESRVKNSRIHTSFKQDGTETGRLASRDPNLQNLPREGTAGRFLADGKLIKKMFVTDPGYVWLWADYSQAELRTLGMYTACPALVNAYRRGEDIHRAVAAEIYQIPYSDVESWQRSEAKAVNFGIIYGQTEMGIAEKFIEELLKEWKKGERLQGYTEDQVIQTARGKASAFFAGHKHKMPEVWSWMDEQEAFIRKYSYQETFFGRRRRYEFVTKATIRQGYNFPIQSTASDFTLYALVLIGRALRSLKLDAYPLLTVHDSIGFQVREAHFWETARVVKQVMENLPFYFITVPLVADLEAGYSWGELKTINPFTETIAA